MLRFEIRAVTSLALFAFLGALTGLAARAQGGPVSFVGPERVVSTGVVSDLSGAAVGAGGESFVVAWSGAIEDQGDGVFFRRFDAEGEAIGGPVSSVSRGRGSEPGLAGRPGGAFALSQWELSGNDRVLRLGLYRRNGAWEGRLLTLGDPQRGLFPPPAAVTGSAGSGRVVAAWARAETAGSGEENGVAAQPVSSAGNPVGARIPVASMVGRVGDVAVAAADDGSFVVAWVGGEPGGASEVFLRRYGAEGDPLGPGIPIADGPSEGVGAAAGTGGDVFVAFTTIEEDSERDLWLRRLRPDGTLDPPVLVAASVSLLSRPPQLDLAVAPNGAVLATWADLSELEPGGDVFARAFDSGGRSLTGRFRLHADPAGDQGFPAVAAVGESRFAVVWSSRDFGGPDPTEVRGRLLRVEPDAASLGEPPPRPLAVHQVACDEARLQGLLARLEVGAPNASSAARPPGVVAGFTRSGDFAGVAHVGRGAGAPEADVAESLLTFGTNPEETPLLRNPERPPLSSVSLSRVPPASDLVSPDDPGLLRVVLNPTLELARPDPAALLWIDNRSGPGGVSADAKPGRGLKGLLVPCHEELVESDARIARVLRRIVRGEAAGAAAFEAAVYRGERPGVFRIDLYPKGPDGESLGRLAAELVVELTPGGLLWTGELRSRPRCGDGTTRGCTSVAAPTVLKLVQPTFAGPTGAGPPPPEVRLEASGGVDPPREVRFLWEDLLDGSTWLGGTP